jgi:hypothetical protein
MCKFSGGGWYCKSVLIKVGLDYRSSTVVHFHILATGDIYIEHFTILKLQDPLREFLQHLSDCRVLKKLFYDLVMYLFIIYFYWRRQ